MGYPNTQHRPTALWQVDVDLDETGLDPVECARDAYETIKASAMLPVITVFMGDDSQVDVDLDEVGLR